MPDQDDFEPLARQWSHTYDLYLGNGTVEEVAQEAIRVVAKMIRRCGGCPSLPELGEALWQFYQAKHPQKLWDWQSSTTPERRLSQKLEQLTQSAKDQRIDAVATRSALVVATQLVAGSFQPQHLSDLTLHLASCIPRDLICHSVLDTARAFAVGNRFSNGAESHQFHNAVIDRLARPFGKMGAKLAQDPSGAGIKKIHLLPQQSTVAMLYDEDRYRLD